jgi:hypothetical protein
MSGRRRVKLHREKLADRLAAERVKNAPPVGMAAVLERIAEHGRSESKQLALGEGARPNNMAPSKYTAGKPSPKVTSANIIYQGIDSIWLNYYGTIREDVLECLDWAKEDAQEADAGEALSPFPPFDGTTPLMLGQGLPFYAYRAISQDVQAQIRKPNKKSPRPVAIVRVSAEALARLGGGGVVAAREAEGWLRPLFEAEGYRVTVSHVHLATDYQGYVPAFADLDNVVSRAGGEGRPRDDETGNGAFWDRAKRLTGIASGKSNNLRLNMYDKVGQVRKKGLTWVFDMWERSAVYEVGAPTWRAELQFGRKLLRDRGIETLDDLVLALPALWAYGMGWYSFRVPNKTDSNKSRWAVAGWWQDISTWGGVDAPALPRVKVVRPRLHRITAGLLGYLTTTMVLTGLESYQDALQAAIDVEVGKAGAARLDRRLAAKHLRYAGFTMGDA